MQRSDGLFSALAEVSRRDFYEVMYRACGDYGVKFKSGGRNDRCFNRT